jgi:ElaB/YqjD/DUF883 family membrane-anchored ribosome-binding protein
VVGLGLTVAAVAGFVLGACGGGEGSALTTRTGVTATRPAATATRPEVTIPTRTTPTVPTPTVPTPTVEPPVETTPTVTVVETETETEIETEIETETETEVETTEPAPTEATTTEAEPTPTETTAAAETSSESDTPWGWIALAAALLLGLVIGLLVWRRRRSAAASWSGRLADLSRRALVALDAVLAEGSVVTGQIQALAAEARSLETRAPDDPSRAAAGRVRASLDELAGTLEVDRNLRLGSPPPSPEQLSYSTALIRRQVESLQSVLRPTSPAPPA